MKKLLLYQDEWLDTLRALKFAHSYTSNLEDYSTRLICIIAKLEAAIERYGDGTTSKEKANSS